MASYSSSAELIANASNLSTALRTVFEVYGTRVCSSLAELSRLQKSLPISSDSSTDFEDAPISWECQYENQVKPHLGIRLLNDKVPFHILRYRETCERWRKKKLREMGGSAVCSCSANMDIQKLTTPGYVWLSYEETGHLSNAIASSLKCTLKASDDSMVGICCENGPEWVLMDLACALGNYSNVGIHKEWFRSVENISHILNETEISVLLIDDESLENLINCLLKLLLAATSHSDTKDRGVHLKYVIFVDKNEDASRSKYRKKKFKEDASYLEQKYSITFISFHDLLESGFLAYEKSIKSSDLISERSGDITVNEVNDDKCFTVIYSSGTTGKPKGIEISQGMWRSGCSAGGVSLCEEKVSVSYMPLAHGADRGIVWQTTFCGGRIAFICGKSIQKSPTLGGYENFFKDMRLVRPRFFMGMSNLWTDIYTLVYKYDLEREVEKQIAVRFQFDLKKLKFEDKKLYQDILDTYLTTCQGISTKQDKISCIRELFGGELNMCVTGGSCTSAAVFDFAKHCLSPGNEERMFDAYGLSEFPGISQNGIINDAVDLKLVDSGDYTNNDTPYPRGEIVVRYKSGLKCRYWKNKEATDEAFRDGWFYTGDIGMLKEGKLSIIDRVKNVEEVYWQGFSKFISVSTLERNIYEQSTFVYKIVLCGDRMRDGLVAIVKVQEKAYMDWKTSSHICEKKGKSMKQTERNRTEHLHCLSLEILKSLVDLGKDNDLKPYEIPIAVIPILNKDVWTVENGILSAVGKINRGKIKQVYREDIAKVFASATSASHDQNMSSNQSNTLKQATKKRNSEGRQIMELHGAVDNNRAVSVLNAIRKHVAYEKQNLVGRNVDTRDMISPSSWMDSFSFSKVMKSSPPNPEPIVQERGLDKVTSQNEYDYQYTKVLVNVQLVSPDVDSSSTIVIANALDTIDMVKHYIYLNEGILERNQLLYCHKDQCNSMHGYKTSFKNWLGKTGLLYSDKGAPLSGSMMLSELDCSLFPGADQVYNGEQYSLAIKLVCTTQSDKEGYTDLKPEVQRELNLVLDDLKLSGKLIQKKHSEWTKLWEHKCELAENNLKNIVRLSNKIIDGFVNSEIVFTMKHIETLIQILQWTRTFVILAREESESIDHGKERATAYEKLNRSINELRSLGELVGVNTKSLPICYSTKWLFYDMESNNSSEDELGGIGLGDCKVICSFCGSLIDAEEGECPPQGRVPRFHNIDSAVSVDRHINCHGAMQKLEGSVKRFLQDKPSNIKLNELIMKRKIQSFDKCSFSGNYWVKDLEHIIHLQNKVKRFPRSEETPEGMICQAFKHYSNRLALGEPQQYRELGHNRNISPDMAAGLMLTPHEGYLWLTYGQLGLLVERVARGLTSISGLKPGAFVGICGYNRFEYVICDFACAVAGFVPIGVHTTYSQNEVRKVFKNAKFDAFICSQEVLHRDNNWCMSDALKDKDVSSSLRAVMVMDANITKETTEKLNISASGKPKLLSIVDFLAKNSPGAYSLVDPVSNQSLYDRKGNDIFTVLYTSGSGGSQSKGVMVSSSAFVNDIGEKSFANSLVTVSYIALSHSSDRMKTWEFIGNGGRVGFAYYDANNWREHETSKKDGMIRSPTVKGSTMGGVCELFSQVRLLSPTAMACPPQIWNALYDFYCQHRDYVFCTLQRIYVEMLWTKVVDLYLLPNESFKNQDRERLRNDIEEKIHQEIASIDVEEVYKSIAIENVSSSNSTIDRIRSLHLNIFDTIFKHCWKELKSHQQSLSSVFGDNMEETKSVKGLFANQLKKFIVQTLNSEADKVSKQIIRSMFGTKPRIRFLITGGAPTAYSVKLFAQSLFIEAAFSDSYGTTESGGISSNGEILSSKGVKVRLIDVPELGFTSSDVPFARGEILVQSPNMSDGYYGNKKLTNDAFVTITENEKQAFEPTLPVGRWYRTGDIGMFNHQGRLSVIERKNAVASNSLGMVFYPMQIEAELETSRFVRHAFVYVNPKTHVLLVVIQPNAAKMMDWFAEFKRSNDLSMSLDQMKQMVSLNDNINIVSQKSISLECDTSRSPADNIQSFIHESFSHVVLNDSLGDKLGVKTESFEFWFELNNQWTVENRMLTGSLKKARKNLEHRYIKRWGRINQDS